MKLAEGFQVKLKGVLSTPSNQEHIGLFDRE